MNQNGPQDLRGDGGHATNEPKVRARLRGDRGGEHKTAKTGPGSLWQLGLAVKSFFPNPPWQLGRG